MRELSADELAELSRAFGIDVGETELEDVLEYVNENIETVDAVYDLPDRTEATDVGDRTWHRSVDDPHNAIVTACDVPPTDDHSGELAGVSVGVKDIIAVAGVPMEGGSDVMRGFVPGTDATVIQRLRGAGATIAAKTNLDEFAVGARGVSYAGQMTNPHDEGHIPGGSSGGSAIAVLTGQVDVALGTDTGGSVRMPAAHCGIVGLKPTYGLVPLSGVVENTYALDHVGPMTRSVEDAARVLDAVAGKDTMDAASMYAAGMDGYTLGDYVRGATTPQPTAGLSVGLVEEGFGRGAAEDEVADPIVDRTEAVADRLEDGGASVRSVSVEHFEHSGAIKYALSYGEMAAHWRAGGASYRRNGRVDEGYQTAFSRRSTAASGEFNPYFRARALTGAYMIEHYGGRHYSRAQAAREVLSEEVDEALSSVDVLLLPTTPSTAPRLDEALDPGFAYSRNTHPANVTGMPAITLPNGSVDGLPVGVQLLGPRFSEESLLSAAARIEAELGS